MKPLARLTLPSTVMSLSVSRLNRETSPAMSSRTIFTCPQFAACSVREKTTLRIAASFAASALSAAAEVQ
jgi:hypothetical protein